MQKWHILAENEREGGIIEFDLLNPHIELIIKVMCKQKHNQKLGNLFREVYIDTKQGGEERLRELGLF